MSDDRAEETRPAVCWLDVFPWVKAVGVDHSGDTSAWWNEPVDQPGSDRRADRLAQISGLAIERLGRWTIGQIFPGVPGQTRLDLLHLNSRARNAVGRAGCTTVNDLQNVELADILDWQRVGVGTVDNLLRTLADVATGAPVPTSPSDPSSTVRQVFAAIPVGLDQPWMSALVTDLGVVASWLAAVGAADTDVLRTPLPEGTPAAVLDARQRIGTLTVTDVLGPERAGLDAAELLDRSIRTLDARARLILRRRLFADAPVTLDDLGNELGVTRERVRQIEAKARATMVETIGPGGQLKTLAEATRSLIGSVLPLQALLDLVPALANEVGSAGQPAWRVLDRLDDAFEIESGWCVAPTMQAAQSALQTRLSEVANAHGVVRIEDIGEISGTIAVERRRESLIAWLQYCGYFVEGDHVVTRRQRIGDLAASILSIVGTPLPTEELLARFGVERTLSSVRNALAVDDRFERVDRDCWALAEWGLDAYTGLRALVRDEVAAAGGQIEMDRLIERITGQYTVSASSVVAYASSPPFKATGGVVRIASGETVVRKTPAQTRRLYRRADGWVYRIRVTKDHLRGSGFVAPIALAGLLGVQFGETRLLDSPLGAQPVHWTGIQPAFGSIRRLLIAADIAADRDLLLKLDDSGKFDIEPVRSSTDSALADALALIGADEDVVNPAGTFASAVGLPVGSSVSTILGAYRERGDTDVFDLLVTCREVLEVADAPAVDPATVEIDEILDLL